MLMGSMAPCRGAELSALSAVLYDPLTEQVLFEKNGREVHSMASTTKIMTALVALEIYDPESWVEIRPEWTGIEGSSMYLKPGEQLQIIDLLYGLMLMSGNDAAAALAGMLTGTEADFVSLMNRKAEELGLTDSSFANPHGLEEEGHYSTAFDLARLMAEAMENPIFREITGTESCQRANRVMGNHNKLLRLYEGCIGGKTGYTRKAGRCLVTIAEREGRQLIAVTMQAPDDWKDHATLYDSVFSRLERAELCRRGIAAKIPLAGGGGCGVYADEEYSLALLPGEMKKIKTEIHGARMIYGPANAGAHYGHLIVRMGEQVVFTTPLYYEKDIPAPQSASRWEAFCGWLRSR